MYNEANANHIALYYMAFGKEGTFAYANSPRAAADAFVAKYPRLRKPFEVTLAQEFKSDKGEIMIRFGSSWPQFRNLTKKILEPLPTVAFPDTEGTRASLEKVVSVVLFHLPKHT